MKPPSLSNVLTLGLIGAMVTTSATGAQSPEPPTLKGNSILFAQGNPFQAFGPGSEAMNEMRARLEDPQKRAVLRDEHRQRILETHYGVAEALELDEATYQALIDLLTDQQMAQLDEFHLRMAQPPEPGRDPTKLMHVRAERMSKDLDALRDVLGQEKLERYQELRPSLGERAQVRELDDRLDASNKLNITQQERLVELLHDHNVRSLKQRRGQMFAGPSRLGTTLRDMPSREEMERRSLLDTIASNEEHWRQMSLSNGELREQAASILTAPQLAVLEQIHVERAQALQQRIEQMRVQAGLSPTIPEQAEDVAPEPIQVAGDVKLSMRLSVNRAEPKYFTEVVGNGKSVRFEVGEGLFVEATPTIYTNDMYELDLAYYESGANGKRLVGNMGQMGSVLPRDDASLQQRLSYGGGATVLIGSKVYAIEMRTVVEST